MSTRAHSVSPYRVALEHAQEALLAALTRRTEVRETIEVGESAQKVSYVKSLTTARHEYESWPDWIDRTIAMFAAARDGLPPAPEKPEPSDEAAAHGQRVRAAIIARNATKTKT